MLKTRLVRIGVVMALSCAGCGYSAVKTAVHSYGAAVDGATQAGVALLAECSTPAQNPDQEQRRKVSCEQAAKEFEAIQTSAAQLQNIN
jgi:hypothetical protein